MNLEGKTIGFALCGSFCTFSRVLPVMETLKQTGCEIIPILSGAAYETDTRFGKATEHMERIKAITGREPFHTIAEVEPFGPKKLLDALVIAPCTGNTLGKIAGGISDTSVSLATKSHLRNQRPVVIAVSSNDALSANAKNLGALLNTNHIFFVPFEQDEPVKKPTSLVARFELIPETVELALLGQQIQPMVCQKM